MEHLVCVEVLLPYLEEFLVLVDNLGDLRSGCGGGNCELQAWVRGDDKSDGGDRGVDGGGNGEGKETVDSVPDIRVDGCRICGHHPLENFDGIIGRDAVHPRN